MLTGVGDERRRPDFEVNGVGRFGLQTNDGCTPVHLR
jgi:hypothetical protein